MYSTVSSNEWCYHLVSQVVLIITIMIEHVNNFTLQVYLAQVYHLAGKLCEVIEFVISSFTLVLHLPATMNE